MRYYYMLLFAYSAIFTAANLIVFIVYFLFTKISKSFFANRMKHAKLSPIESVYLVFRGYPNEFGRYISKKSKMYKNFAKFYFIILEILDLAAMFYSGKSVLICRVTIIAMFVALLSLIVSAIFYTSKVRKLNEKRNVEIEELKKECEEVLNNSSEFFRDADTLVDAANSNEIIEGKEFLKYIVENQLISEVLPKGFV